MHGACYLFNSISWRAKSFRSLGLILFQLLYLGGPRDHLLFSLSRSTFASCSSVLLSKDIDELEAYICWCYCQIQPRNDEF